MLQSIREKAQGWIAWLIVIFISIPFALWGIQEYLGVGSEQVKALVNGQEIKEREFEKYYRQYRQNLRQSLGSAYRPELIDDALLRKEILDSLIRSELIQQASDRMGLRAGDDLIRGVIANIPAFQINGRFSQEAYQRAVSSQSLSEAGFEHQIRASLVSEQLNGAIANSEMVIGRELADTVRLQHQKRDLGYLIIPVADFIDEVVLEEGEGKRYFDANPNEFMAPERVRVEYLELDVARIAETVKVDEELLLGYYEQHKDEYMRPEQRKGGHILIALEEGADEAAVAAARVEAEAALARIRAGEDFGAVAKEVSADTLSAEQGGDLGLLIKDTIDDAFDKVAFKLAQGEVSEPIRTPFGFHLIRVTEILPPSGKSFAEAKDDVAGSYRKNEAERLFYEYAERLGDLAYEHADTLEPASDALGLKPVESDWITRDGGKGVFASGKVVSSAFSADVLVAGNNSEAIELGAEHVVVLRVIDHEEAHVRPFDDVKAAIDSKLKNRKAAEKAKAKGEALLARLREGTDPAQLFAEEGRELKRVDGIKRTPDGDLQPAIQNSLFRLARPVDGKASFGEAVLQGGDYAVVALYGVTDGSLDSLKDDDKKRLQAQLVRSKGRAYFDHLVGNLRDSADIQITPAKE
jgi:peptidyl-prolyl cis-trans isomerase D